MKIIGITGNMGSGKSIVSRLFESMGIPVYIADIESKKLTESSSVIKEKLIEKFGKNLYQENNLDKKQLADLIFNNKQNLEYVNSVIHPEVHKDFNEWTSRHRAYDLLAIESAILFESGFKRSVDFSVNISSPLEIRIQRVMKRDRITREAVILRLNNQLSDEEKNKLADFVIINDDKKAVIPQTENLLNLLNLLK